MDMGLQLWNFQGHATEMVEKVKGDVPSAKTGDP